jgi:opacity protein-like surface antigen
MIRRATTLAAFAAVAILAFAPRPAAAASAMVATGIGPRIGFSSGPDQLVFGGQLTFGEVAPNLSFDPNLEIGVGDNATLIGFNFDLHYHFDTNTTWRPYAGGGVGINYISVDRPAPFDNATDPEYGGQVIVGAGAPTRSGNRFFGELKLGLGDVPDLKMVVGWNFKM